MEFLGITRKIKTFVEEDKEIVKGFSKTSEYHIWRTMLARCYNPKCKKFPRYGGRGIKVCKRWKSSFQNFLEDMGLRPVGLSIERKNNNGNYEPNNCIWATAKQQAQNRELRKICKRGHPMIPKQGGCKECQRERNKEFMRRVRKETPERWRNQ
jgi:hypothetical protein